MNITFYKTNSRVNDLRKTLTSGKSYDNIKLKDETNILYPTIRLLNFDGVIKFNYCYIEKFNRYYFINNVTYLSNNIVELSCNVDVLMSYKSYIQNLKVITSRQKTLGNNELVDNRLKLLNYPTIETSTVFPKGFVDSSSGNNFQYIMITTGGDV